MKARLSILLALLLVSFGLGGCSSSTTPDGDGDGDSDGDTDGDADGDTDGDADGDGDADCPTENPEVVASWSIDDYSITDIDTPCVVSAVDAEDYAGRMTLTCGSGALMEEHVIEYECSPVIWLLLHEGDEVYLRYRTDPIWWIDRFFTLRSASGGLILAGIDASAIVPPEVDSAEWYAPLDPRVVRDVCPLADDTCGPTERVGIEFSYGGMTTTVFSRGSGEAGMMDAYELTVQTAELIIDDHCEDSSGGWFTALITVIPEG